jgi:hypothetical protein
MTTLNQLETHIEATKDLTAEALMWDTWRSTSYLIQVLCKTESYLESLDEQNPEDDFFTAKVAVSSALELINGTYKVPVSDERFEKVQELYEATIVTFIRDISDDAFADMIYLGQLAKWVADMRVYAINEWIKESGPSEVRFNLLKTAKRDSKAVELAVKTLSDVIFAENA